MKETILLKISRTSFFKLVKKYEASPEQQFFHSHSAYDIIESRAASWVME